MDILHNAYESDIVPISYKTISYRKTLLLLFYVSVGFCVAFSNNIFNILITASFMLLLFTENRYLALPALHIFQDYLYFPFVSVGLSKYAIILILISELFLQKKIFLSKNRYLQFIVCILYTLFILYPNKSLNALVYIPVMACYVCLFSYLNVHRDKFKRFCEFYVISMLLSLIIGIIQNRFHSEDVEIGYGSMSLTRFFATFSDPNYAGMFINVAIFMCVILKLFNKKIRTIFIIILYIGLIMTMSMTAIISNTLTLMFFLFVKNGKSIKSFAVILFCVLSIIGVYNYGLNSDIEILNSICTRINLKLDALISQGDVSAFLSGRSILIEEHWNYFVQKGTVFNWIFGGIPSTALYCTPAISGRVAHMEYIDLMLNIGIVGFVVYMGCMIVRSISNIKKYISTRDDQALLKLVIFANYLICGFSLTLFMEPMAFIWIFI